MHSHTRMHTNTTNAHDMGTNMNTRRTRMHTDGRTDGRTDDDGRSMTKRQLNSIKFKFRWIFNSRFRRLQHRISSLQIDFSDRQLLGRLWVNTVQQVVRYGLLCIYLFYLFIYVAKSKEEDSYYSCAVNEVYINYQCVLMWYGCKVDDYNIYVMLMLLHNVDVMLI